MRVTVNLSKADKNLIIKLCKDPLLNSRKLVVRLAIALGLSKLVSGYNIVKNETGSESFRFNTKTVDPEDIFEVMAYFIIAKRMGASKNNKKIILASKEELGETIGEAFLIGLQELPNFNYSNMINQNI